MLEVPTQLSTERPSGVQSAVLHGSDRVAPYFLLVQIPGKQSKVLSESIRRVGEETRSLPGWGGINNGIRDFRYNLYAPVLLGIQLQGLQDCGGWSPLTGQECSETLLLPILLPHLLVSIHSLVHLFTPCLLPESDAASSSIGTGELSMDFKHGDSNIKYDF